MRRQPDRIVLTFSVHKGNLHYLLFVEEWGNAAPKITYAGKGSFLIKKKIVLGSHKKEVKNNRLNPSREQLELGA